MKKFIRIFSIVMCVIMLAGFGNSLVDAAEKDTLTVVIYADPGSLDPHDTTGVPHHQVTRQIFETLVVRGVDGKLQPWLAEKWEYEDDTTLVMQIRKGVLFHNGEELKANDVLFSLKRMREDNTTAAMQVTAIDFDKSSVEGEYTLKIVTHEPSPMLLAQLENPMAAIISEKSYSENSGNFFDAGSIGTGPYKLVSYRSGDRVTLVGNDKYWIEGQPKINNLVIKIITDGSSRAIEAESGGADIVYDISPNDVDRVDATDGVSMVRSIGTKTEFISLNASNKPLDDIRVRQAIFYALDLDQIAAVAFGSYGLKATGIISPGVDGRVDLTSTFVARDISKAKELLAEAGYPEGLTLELTAPNTDQLRMDICEAAQAQLSEAGIQVKINYKEFNTWVSDMISGNATIGEYAFTASTGEAGRVLMRFMPEYSESKVFSWYDDEYIRVCKQALRTIDDTERNKLFAQCQQMLMDAFIIYPVWHKEINAAVQDYVKGFKIETSYEQHYLQTVYFD